MKHKSAPIPPVLPFRDLRSTGTLWAINRTLFHPRGFGLALNYPDASGTGSPTGWCLEGDGSEQYEYPNNVTHHCFDDFEAFLARHRA